MRFCPFCSAENADESAVCASCGRRLPPLPPRRAGSKGQPTGVILPPRPTVAGTPPPSQRKPPTMPPPIPSAASPARQVDATQVNPSRESAPSLPPPPVVDDEWNDAAAELRNAIDPGPAAQRREPPPVEPAGSGPARRKSDSKAPPVPPAAYARSSSPNDSGYGRGPNDSGYGRGPNDSGYGRGPNDSGYGRGPNDSGYGRAPGSGAIPVPTRGGSGSIPTEAVTFERSKSPVPPSHERSKSPSVPPPHDRSKSPSVPPLGERSKSPSVPPPFDRNRAASQPPVRPLDNFGGETEIDPAAAFKANESQTLPVPRPSESSVFAPPAQSNVFAPKPASAPAPSLQVASTRSRALGGIEPPPTRIHRPEALVDRPFTPQKVNPIPGIPEPGLVTAARYAYQFALARWQRRGAIKTLGIEIKQDTEALDQVLGALGRAARGARVEGRVFSAENAAITAAEERVSSLQRESGDVEGRKAEENSKFVDVERERNEKLVEAERMVEEAQRELQHLEAQRRSLRDRRKELERRQKAYLKNADDNDRQAGSAPLGDQRQELRRAAEGHRKEAAALEPSKQDLDRQITGLERPINEATARLDAAKAELDAAKRSLSDVREGHTHRLAELDAEQKRKAREVALAEAEIQRRLVTLGTLVNLNRIEDPQFAELYQRIDRIRGAITARTTEIEKLTAEREAYDRGTLVRGIATIGGAFVALIALIVILRAVL
jgi:hypothetical protein